MNSSLHQWAAEISTNKSRACLTAVESPVYGAPLVCTCISVEVHVSADATLKPNCYNCMCFYINTIHDIIEESSACCCSRIVIFFLFRNAMAR